MSEIRYTGGEMDMRINRGSFSLPHENHGVATGFVGGERYPKPFVTVRVDANANRQRFGSRDEVFEAINEGLRAVGRNPDSVDDEGFRRYGKSVLAGVSDAIITAHPQEVDAIAAFATVMMDHEPEAAKLLGKPVRHYPTDVIKVPESSITDTITEYGIYRIGGCLEVPMSHVVIIEPATA